MNSKGTPKTKRGTHRNTNGMRVSLKAMMMRPVVGGERVIEETLPMLRMRMRLMKMVIRKMVKKKGGFLPLTQMTVMNLIHNHIE